MLILCVGCRAEPPAVSSPIDEGPPIVLDKLYVEERRDGRVVWSAKAPRAQGSAQRANVTELALHVNDAADGPGGLALMAASAELMMDSGEFVLHDLSGHDERGMVFTTEQARFFRHTQALHCERPVQLASPLGELHAAGAQLLWAAGEVDFDGPVTGRLCPPAPAPPPP